MKECRKRLILASGSPRRKELLAYCDIPFGVITADIDETIDLNANLNDEIQKLATRKAQKVFDEHKDAIVIGSDTIVVLDHEVLGKPKNEERSVSMLKKLSGRVHQVITGVCIMSDEKCDTFSISTDVEFFDLSDEEIDEYVSTKEPFDKAGGYGIQGKGALLIKGIQGDYYSVMGFPISRVNQALKRYLKDK